MEADLLVFLSPNFSEHLLDGGRQQGGWGRGRSPRLAVGRDLRRPRHLLGSHDNAEQAGGLSDGRHLASKWCSSRRSSRAGASPLLTAAVPGEDSKKVSRLSFDRRACKSPLLSPTRAFDPTFPCLGPGHSAEKKNSPGGLSFSRLGRLLCAVAPALRIASSSSFFGRDACKRRSF